MKSNAVVARELPYYLQAQDSMHDQTPLATLDFEVYIREALTSTVVLVANL